MKQTPKPSGKPDSESRQDDGHEDGLSESRNSSPRYGSNEEFLRSRVTAFDFTRRQQDVVELVLQGMSNREVAQILKIEVDTVKVHLREIFLKLNVHRRAALVAKLLAPNFLK